MQTLYPLATDEADRRNCRHDANAARSASLRRQNRCQCLALIAHVIVFIKYWLTLLIKFMISKWTFIIRYYATGHGSRPREGFRSSIALQIVPWRMVTNATNAGPGKSGIPCKAQHREVVGRMELQDHNVNVLARARTETSSTLYFSASWDFNERPYKATCKYVHVRVSWSWPNADPTCVYTRCWGGRLQNP